VRRLNRTLHVLDLGIDNLLVGLEVLNDSLPFLASQTSDGPAGLPLRHGGSNVIIRNTDLGPEQGPKEKSAAANAVLQARFAGA
jgi:hypothetical protein